MTAPPVRGELLERFQTRYGRAAVERQLTALVRDARAIDNPELWLSCALEGDFKDMPIEMVSVCPCGSPHLQLLSRFIFWNLLGLRECERCSLLVVSPRLTAAAMTKVFNENYFAGADPSYWGSRREPVFREVVGLLKDVGARRIADVGAAYGHFLRYAVLHGLQGVGCDVARPVVDWGRKEFGLDLRCGSIDVLADAAPVDAVVSLDVLYYCADPVVELTRMRELVRPGGHVVLRLRNPRNVGRRARRSSGSEVRSAPLPAEHLYAFPPGALPHLLRAAGLEPVRCTPGRYSVYRWGPLLQTMAALNRGARRLMPSVPILTQSFNVVARRVG